MFLLTIAALECYDRNSSGLASFTTDQLIYSGHSSLKWRGLELQKKGSDFGIS